MPVTRVSSGRRARPRRRSRRRRARSPATVILVSAIVAATVIGGSTYAYLSLSRLIDSGLRAEDDRAPAHVLARPFRLRRGQVLSDRQLAARLNDLSYVHRAQLEGPGDFAIGRDAVALIPRGGDARGKTVRVVFRHQGGTGADRTGHVEHLEILGEPRPDTVTLEPPLLTTLVSAGREKRWDVPLNRISRHLVQAVLAIEDRRFYEHPGIDVVRIAGALWTNVRGDLPYLVGGSTLTQQLVKNVFLTPEKTVRRKMTEQIMALMVERRLSKDEILRLYLNEVYLGQRGSFAIHGVAQAARFFFEKDVANLTLAESATIAGIIQAPHTYSPFRSLDRARGRRDTVLRAMAEVGIVSEDVLTRAVREPLVVASGAIEAQAPYFLDLVTREVGELRPGDPAAGTRAIYTTLDLHLQRLAQNAVDQGLAAMDTLLAKRASPLPVEAALIAADPRTGDVLALVGGRSYGQSQFNRALSARRQPGSVFKPFVYLAAFEAAAATSRTDVTPATLVDDTPAAFVHDDKVWRPANYGRVYDGRITLRRALALSRNIPAIKIAESVGYDRVADLWREIGTDTPPQALPAIALGVFETTPFEVATAYTLFPNRGAVQPLRSILRIDDGERMHDVPAKRARQITRPDTTYLVTSMLRSVLSEGTGRAARRAGFVADAAGKSGTTNDLRDAWFVGFTPDLLTVVWVGTDDNHPLGLTGAQAALPIWTTFMRDALAGQRDQGFQVPPGIGFVAVDRETGEVALPGCRDVIREAFLFGTEPLTACHRHRGDRVGPLSHPGYNQ